MRIRPRRRRTRRRKRTEPSASRPCAAAVTGIAATDASRTCRPARVPGVPPPSVGYGVPVSGPALVMPPGMVMMGPGIPAGPGAPIAPGYPGYAPMQPGVMRVPEPPSHHHHHHHHSSSSSSSHAPPPASTRKWRHPIADDFLRIPGVGLPPVPGGPSLAAATGTTSSGGSGGGHGHATSTDDRTLAGDEAYAAMLQNEVFIQQVRHGPIRRDQTSR